MIHLLTILLITYTSSLCLDNIMPQILQHQIQVADKETLQERLNNSGFMGLAKHTSLVTEIAGKSHFPLYVDMSILAALAEYEQKLQMNLAHYYTGENVLKIVLKEYPDIIKAIKDYNDSLVSKKPESQKKIPSVWDKPLIMK